MAHCSSASLSSPSPAAIHPGRPFDLPNYDSGFFSDLFNDDEQSLWLFGQGMNLTLPPALPPRHHHQHYHVPPDDHMSWQATPPDLATLLGRPNAAVSPGTQNQSNHCALALSSAAVSLSSQPEASVFTPSSTGWAEVQDDGSLVEDLEYYHSPPSPGSALGYHDDFVLITRSDGGPRNAHGSLALPSRPFPAASRLSTPTSHPSRESSVAQSLYASHHQPRTSNPTPNVGMEDHLMPYSDADDPLFPTNRLADDGFPSAIIGLQDDFYPIPADSMHLRLCPDGFGQTSAAYSMDSLPSLQPLNHHHAGNTGTVGYVDHSLGHPFPVANQLTSLSQHAIGVRSQDGHSPDNYIHQCTVAESQVLVAHSNAENLHKLQHRHQQYEQHGHPLTFYSSPEPLRVLKDKSSVLADQDPVCLELAPAQSQTRQALVHAALEPVLPGPIRTSHAQRERKGGRMRNTHLNDTSRKKSHVMRKVGACWRCALQRDPCDEGNPCSRCLMRSQKGQAYFFDCDRSKLPDFVHDFLPPSMTIMHQKQSIEDTVKDEVLSWAEDNGIDIYLRSGYGPPLRWKVYEFKPKSPQFLGQLQFLQDRKTGFQQSDVKYAPPFGLLKLDMSDDLRFDAYLDRLLDQDQLLDFGWSCYEEECIFEPGQFQAQLLDLMCQLYIHTQDQPLKSLLRDVLRMMIVTFIMGHTLTIVEDTIPAVLDSVRYSARPSRASKHTSPRLANRQLKFFFAIIRANIYTKILKWQQQTLHTGGKKEMTWLQAFCATLGFAMVLEELQRTIQIQADASVRRSEMSEDAAQAQAFNACERIDQRFKLLVGLFQCKYRDRTWSMGSFGPQTPELKDACANEILGRLRVLVESRRDHLWSREKVPLGKENQHLYTTRLTSRFLLPFLSLPIT